MYSHDDTGRRKTRYVSLTVNMVANMIREEIIRNRYFESYLNTNDYVAGLEVALDYLHYCADINNISGGSTNELL